MEDEQEVIITDTELENAPPRKRMVWAFYAVGVLAIAGAGFGGGAYLFYDPDQKVLISNLQSQQTDLETAALAQTARIAALESQDTKADIKAVLDKLQQEIAKLQASLADMQSRIAVIENRPVPTVDISGYNDQVFADIQAELSAQRALIAGLQNAKPAVPAPNYNTEMALTVQLIDAGQPFDTALANIIAGGALVPLALQDHANLGVAPLTDLQERFPDIARSVLAQSRAAAGQNSWIEYLKTQLSIRSLEPIEGDSVDAILSRAHAALAQGDLQETMVELNALGDINTPALGVWMNEAANAAAVRQGVLKLQETLVKRQAE